MEGRNELSWCHLISSPRTVLVLVAAAVVSRKELTEIENEEAESLSGGCHVLWTPD